MLDSDSRWIIPDWPTPARVRALITTRSGGVSHGPYRSLNLGTRVGDDPAAVEENRRRVRAHLPAEPRWLDQVHGNCAVAAETLESPVAADAAYTGAPEVVCTVMVADCLPILLCDTKGDRVAAAHAGWRGLASGVIEAAIAAIEIPPSRLMAYLGPAIGPRAFEVGAEVRETFVDADQAADAAFAARAQGKWMADLCLLARQRLAHAGVAQVFGGGICTYSEPARFFSHRRDKVSGRMAAFIWLTR